MTCRATMYFNLRSGGWTESLYSADSVSTAYAKILALRDKRIALLVNSAVIHSIGVRDLNNPRVSLNSGIAGSVSGIAGSTLYRDLYNAAVEVQLDTPTSTSRPWLHGLPDDVMVGDANGNFYLQGAAVLAINAYLAFLLGQGWLLRVLDTKLTATTPRIEDITVALGVVTFSLPGNTLAAGDHVIVTGCKGFHANFFNGTWKVKTPGATNVIMTNGNVIPTPFYYDANSGQYRKQGYTTAGINRCVINKVGTKKMGRPTNAPAGRRRATR